MDNQGGHAHRTNGFSTEEQLREMPDFPHQNEDLHIYTLPMTTTTNRQKRSVSHQRKRGFAMRITCQKEDLLQAMNTVQRAMPSKSPLPALEGVYVQAKDNQLRLVCSDLVLCIESSLPAMVSDAGEIVLPGKLFSELVRKLPEGTVTMDIHDLKANIACGQAKMTLQGMDAADYPEMPAMNQARPLEIKQGDLKSMIQKTSFAVAQDETKPILMGELMEIETDHVTLVALDGYRLAMCTQALEKENSAPVRFVVPGKSLAEIAKLFEDSQANASISFSDTQAVVDMGSTKITTRLLEGEYINYRQILPADRKTRVRIRTADLYDAVERASLMAREGRNNLIRLEVGESKLSITANSELGNAFEEIPVDIDGFYFQSFAVCDSSSRRQRIFISGVAGTYLTQQGRRSIYSAVLFLH